MEKVNENYSNSEKWIKHYSSSHKILLVGEGDFSFAACLAKAFGSATNMVATSLDSREEVIVKYSGATSNLKELEERGCILVHEVDAHSMNHISLLHQESFDRVVFNFPHTGLIPIREHNVLQIQLHQLLVKGFFRSAKDMLKESGQVHVTHKTTTPFDRWEIEKLAEEAGLCVVEKVPFKLWDYPGYVNKKGYGICDRTFPVGECQTFKFAKP